MARQPMVTRTIQTTEATVMMVNTSTGEVTHEVITVPRTYKDDKSLMKAITAVHNVPDKKPVHIMSKLVNEQLYGMPEAEFVRLAKPTTKDEPSAEVMDVVSTPNDSANKN